MGIPKCVTTKVGTVFAFAKGLFEVILPEVPSAGEVVAVEYRNLLVPSLVEKMGISPFGLTRFHFDNTEKVISLACKMGGVWPDSPQELSRRLDYDVLAGAYSEEALAAVGPKEVEKVRELFDALVESGNASALLAEITDKP